MRRGSRKNIPRPGLVVLVGLFCLYMIRKVQLLSNGVASSDKLQYPWGERKVDYKLKLGECKNDTQQYILALVRIPKTGRWVHKMNDGNLSDI